MYNEILIQSIRVGLLHTPDFDDMGYLKSIVDSPSLAEQDPTFVFIKPLVGSTHPVIESLHTQHRFTDVFVPTASDTRWERVYDEISEYCTHLIVIFKDTDVSFKEYLRRKDRIKRPTKVMMI